VPPPQQRGTVASGDELIALMANPQPFLRLYMLLYFQCGLRSSEALAVTPRSWNTENHTVTIPVKGKRVRTAEVTPEVESLFIAANAPQTEDRSFIELLRGRKVTQSAIRQAWERHRRDSGVSEEVTAHDLRRTAATILYNITKDLRVPQQLLGHQNLNSTLRYIAPMAPDEARRYAALLQFGHFKGGEKQ
jgi:integrase